MKRTTRLMLSVASGILAAGLALWYGSSVRAEADQARQEVLAAYGGELVSVCVASHDVDAGEVLSEANVQVEEWVASLLPDEAETSLEDLVGQRATSSSSVATSIGRASSAARAARISSSVGKLVQTWRLKLSSSACCPS